MLGMRAMQNSKNFKKGKVKGKEEKENLKERE
jgi:hypothetical protein